MKESKELAKTIKKSTNELIEKISFLTSELDDAEYSVRQLSEEVEGLQEIVDEGRFTLTKEQNNLRTSSCFEKLFNNLDRIPINELEELTEKYSL